MSKAARAEPLLSAPEDDDGVDELLSRPTAGSLATLARLDGDVMVLGAGGKMGPTLARMIRRGWDELGRDHKVTGVARFSNPATAGRLREVGVETLSCDLLDSDAVESLPEAQHVIFMAGQKFGTSGGPDLTWAMNTLVPAYIADRFRRSRIVVFSTGCVYPLTPVQQGGSVETDELDAPGDYAQSCVGRERIFTYFSRKHGTPVSIMRLNYAVDLRYGVLLDIALKVFKGEPVDVTTGHVNVIWQGDANAQAIQCLEHAAAPPFIINVTGPETLAVRDLTHRFGELFGREPIITGQEAATAWLNNSARAQKLFGPPTVSLEQMVERVAQWVGQGGHTLNKPTHFEARDGKF